MIIENQIYLADNSEGVTVIFCVYYYPSI